MHQAFLVSIAMRCVVSMLSLGSAVLAAQEPSIVTTPATTAATAPKVAEGTAWKETGRLATKHATQGAAADDKFVYGISNEAVAKLDRRTGELISLSDGKFVHLNAGVFIDGKLILAHSNYPRRPETSQVLALDPAEMKLAIVKDFGQSDGSLVWVLRHEGHWWANFAFYGDEYAKSYLARFDDKWNEVQRWTYPEELLEQLHKSSLSGGIWRDGELLATGHDDKILFRLQAPEQDKTLKLLGSEKIAFTGQGFAEDPVTGGLVGIDRARRQILFVERAED